MNRLGADFIGPEHLDRFRWWKPAREPSWPTWYYWTPRRKAHSGSPVDVSTVDPMLVRLVSLVQQHGGLTTPSCQGHFYDPLQVDAAHLALKLEEKALRKGELTLYDVESAEVVQPIVPDWSAPSRTQMHHAARRHSGVGRIGVLLPGGERLDYEVRAESPAELAWKWSNITAQVEDQLSKM